MGILFAPFALIAAPLSYLFNGDFETFSEAFSFIFTEFFPLAFEKLFEGLI